MDKTSERQQKPKAQNYLVDVDVLLDTRLATLASIDQQYPTIALNRGYASRLGDYQLAELCPGLNQDAFNKAYRERDYQTLRNSIATSYLTRLVSDLNYVVHNSVSNPYVTTISLDINTYPYLLSDAELDELCVIVRELVGSGIKVGTVRIPMEKITPKRLRTYSVYAMYDFNSWLTQHEQELLDNPMASVTVVAPANFLQAMDSSINLQEFITEHTVALQNHLSVEWVPLKMMSVGI